MKYKKGDNVLFFRDYDRKKFIGEIINEYNSLFQEIYKIFYIDNNINNCYIVYENNILGKVFV